MTPSGIEPLTFWFVAQYFNLCATAVPNMMDHKESNSVSLQLESNLLEYGNDAAVSSHYFVTIATCLASEIWIHSSACKLMEIREDLACITEANCVPECANTGKPTAVLNIVGNIWCCLKSHLNNHYSLQSYRAIVNQGGPGMLALGLIWPLIREQLLLH
jgi:hypothetical protein